MERYLEFMDRYDPGYRGRIAGVGEREIGVLEEIYGRRLPESYRWFLLHMGRSCGGLAPMYKTNWSYDWALEYLQDPFAHEARVAMHAYCVFAASMVVTDGQVALLDREPGEPRVVHTDFEVGRTFSRSLLNLMMQRAYGEYVLGEHPHRRDWAGRALVDRSRAIGVVRGLGFEPLWFSDEYNYVAERNQDRLILEQVDEDLMSIALRSPRESVLDEVDAVVERELNLSTKRVVFVDW